MIHVRYTPPQPFADADEARIRTVLLAIDPLLDLRWFPFAIFNENVEKYEGRYALICRWAQGDPRYELLNKGEIGEQDAVDIIGWFCEDRNDAETTPVEVEAVENLALELLASCDNSRTPAIERMRAISAKNVKARRERKQEVLDVGQEAAEQVWFQKTPKIFVPSSFKGEESGS